MVIYDNPFFFLFLARHAIKGSAAADPLIAPHQKVFNAKHKNKGLGIIIGYVLSSSATKLPPTKLQKSHGFTE